MIHDIGLWVLEQACEQINRWRGQLSWTDLPPVGVNVLGRQIFHDGFLGRVREILERNGIEGRQIRFDIGVDGCNGAFGWYVDDVNVYQCEIKD